MESNLLSKIMEKLSLSIFIVGLILTAALPFWTPLLLNFWDKTDIQWLFIKCLVVLYPVGIIALIAVWDTFQMMRNINHQQPFIMNNAKRIKRIAVLCVIEALLFYISVFVWKAPSMFIVAIPFTLFSCYLFVMGKLFKQAVIYKEENDLTI